MQTNAEALTWWRHLQATVAQDDYRFRRLVSAGIHERPPLAVRVAVDDDARHGEHLLDLCRMPLDDFGHATPSGARRSTKASTKAFTASCRMVINVTASC